MLFRGSDAVAAGFLTRGQLRGPSFTRLFRDVYVDRGTTVTHEVRCRARGEAVPWHEGRIATSLRMALDLALDRPVPVAVAVADVVLRRGLVDLTALTDLVYSRSDRGIRDARLAVSLVDPLAESRPESQVRVHLVLAGLTPVPQYWIEDADGRIARSDLALPERKVAVEYDGRWRDGQLWALDRDRERLNRVHAAGWDVVFVTAPLTATPRKMVATVRAALDARLIVP